MRKLAGTTAALTRASLLFMLLQATGWAAAVQTPELTNSPIVHISDQGGTLVMDITYQVPVSPRDAWAVLTDFEAMPRFIPNLESSEVLLRTGKTLQVEQKGSLSLGMFPIHYDSTRQIELAPYQTIHSHTLSGNTRLDSVMQLSPSGNGTLLSYHATAVADLPVPNSLISSYMGEMLETQFKAMGQEMLRRWQPNSTDQATDDTKLAQQSGKQTVRKPAAGKASAAQAKLTPKKSPMQAKKRPG